MVLDRLKKDKKLQKTVFIVGIILLFLISSNTQIKEQSLLKKTFSVQSVCDTCGAGILDNCEVHECLSLGCVANGPEIFEPPFGLIDCKAGLDVGDEVCIDNFHVGDNPQIYKSDGSEMCKSGLARTVDYSIINSPCGALGDTWMCINQDEAEERGITACESWQKPFAGMLDAVWKGNKIDSCSTKAFMVMGFGGMMMMVVI